MLAFGTSTATTAPATPGGTSARAYLEKTNNQLNTSAATTRRAGNERAMAWVND